MKYPITLTPGEDGRVLVTFPDVPEAVCCGPSEAAAIARAGPILDIVLTGYESEGRPIPQPSRIANAPTVSTERFER
jgi:antitoxin HicB